MHIKWGVKHRIAHSHNARQNVSNFTYFLKMIQEWKMETYATDYWGCSKAANRWYFPRKYKQSIVINNAIELDAYQYNDNSRKKIRKELGLSDNDFVIVNVGRYVKQKNQGFLIRLCSSLNTSSKDVHLILAGEGNRNELDSIVKEENAESYIHIIGGRDDIGDILSASDLFALPSLWEGLPIVLIEAQANGLPCVVSNLVTRESDAGIGLTEYLDLDLDIWQKYIDPKKALTTRKRLNSEQYSKLSDNWDINKVAKIVQKLYLSMK